VVGRRVFHATIPIRAAMIDDYQHVLYAKWPGVAHDGRGFDAHARDKLGAGATSSLGRTRTWPAQESEGWRMWDIIHCRYLSVANLPPSTFLVFFFGGLTFTK
jgi:hypothetical protein